MNDTELDHLLDTWEEPAPPPALRENVRAQFPRAPRRSLARPLRWVLAIALASATLAVAVQSAGSNPWDYRLVRTLNRLFQGWADAFEFGQDSFIAQFTLRSDPKVYVDGRLAPPLEKGAAGTLIVQVPGEGAYRIEFYCRRLEGWTEAGRIHGNVIEFRAGGKQVRIECSNALVETDRPVYVLRRE